MTRIAEAPAAERVWTLAMSHKALDLLNALPHGVQAMSNDPRGLAADEELWAELKAALSDAEIVDLTYCAAGWIGFGRATHVLGIDTACALPGRADPLHAPI